MILTPIVKTIKNLSQLLYPSSCVACGNIISPSEVFCDSCACNLKPIVSIFLPVTKNYSLRVIAAAKYQSLLKPLVLKKFSQNILASKQLANIILNVVSPDLLDSNYIVPIPLHWTRYAKRGYNQAHTMARVIGKETNAQVLKILMRKKKTKFQSQLSADLRKENLKDAFSIHPWHKFKGLSHLNGKKIILIDDLCTTGTTLKAAAKMIVSQCKPKSITAVVACRAI